MIAHVLRFGSPGSPGSVNWFAAEANRGAGALIDMNLLDILNGSGPSDNLDESRRRLPMTRGDCPDPDDGPCPYVSCRHHLFLDVSRKTGEIRLNFPELLDVDGTPDLDAMPETCSLRVADAGGYILADMGRMFGVTGERARQLEVRALEQLRQKLEALGVTDSHDADETVGLFESPYTGKVD